MPRVREPGQAGQIGKVLIEAEGHQLVEVAGKFKSLFEDMAIRLYAEEVDSTPAPGRPGRGERNREDVERTAVTLRQRRNRAIPPSVVAVAVQDGGLAGIEGIVLLHRVERTRTIFSEYVTVPRYDSIVNELYTVALNFQIVEIQRNGRCGRWLSCQQPKNRRTHAKNARKNRRRIHTGALRDVYAMYARFI